MKLSFILLTHISHKIYLNGKYTLDNNIIITQQDKGEEKILLFGNKDLISKNNIVKKHNNKYYNGRKLVENNGCFIGCKRYNVYHVLSSKSLNNFNNKKYSVSSLYEDEHENSSNKNNRSFNFNDMASQISSVNSSLSKINLMSYNRGNKQFKKNENITKDFKIIRLCIIIFTIIIIVFVVYQYLILTNYYQKFFNKIDFYFLFRDFIFDLYNLFFSVLSLACTASSTKFDFCTNYMEKLTLLIVRSVYPNVASIFLYLILKQIFIEFDQLLFSQNEILLELLNEKLKKLLKYLSKEKSSINYFFSNRTHYKISQNMINEKISISLLKEDISFNDFILLMTSRFRILTKDFNDIEYPIYILNKTGEYTFNNVYHEEKLNSYQENIYLMILDIKPFSEQADLMTNEITVDMVNIKTKMKNLISLFLTLNFLLIIIFIVILIVYILIYYIIIFKVLKNIHNNLNEKVGEHTIKDIMKQKWNNIKIIFKFYDNDINQTIRYLNGLYEDYINKYNLKIKEETKIIRKSSKEIKKIKKNDNFF